MKVPESSMENSNCHLLAVLLHNSLAMVTRGTRGWNKRQRTSQGQGPSITRTHPTSPVQATPQLWREDLVPFPQGRQRPIPDTKSEVLTDIVSDVGHCEMNGASVPTDYMGVIVRLKFFMKNIAAVYASDLWPL